MPWIMKQLRLIVCVPSIIACEENDVSDFSLK